NGARGCYRFLERVWKLQDMVTDEEGESAALRGILHETIRKVSDDYERMKFNTAIAAMMTLVNEIYAKGSLSRGDFSVLLRLLNPVAPHISEEIWQRLGLSEKYVYQESWPEFDESATVKAEVELAVQICGKLKGRITVPADADAKAVEAAALADDRIKALIGDKPVRKVIVVPGRIVNIVV
ncbi:MAG: class I tRNA ligase family protein, partial [Clostridia bacterium]|nr:class I tRNA ligase family protein [Clostridia bacterium]